MSTFLDFYWAMLEHVPGDARIMRCQFRGDPNDDIPGKWRAKTLGNPDMIDEKANVYLCVSAMRKNSRGEWRRRKENFAGGILLMIDDIGTGIGAKFPMSVLDPLPPTALVETSPNNFQATYFFDSLVTDIKLFDALVRAFIERQFLGTDTGQAGVNRVFRPPVGVNGKEKYGGWTVKLHDWFPDRRYSIERIAEAFDLTLVLEQRIRKDARLMNALMGDRVEAFIAARVALRGAGMIKNEAADYSGWIQISCPWVGDHTDGADTGAAIRIPAIENEWYGGFRCHHAHCEGYGWRELTDWLNEEQTPLMEMVNEAAPEKLGELLG